jgi:chromosome segregation ATPase
VLTGSAHRVWTAGAENGGSRSAAIHVFIEKGLPSPRGAVMGMVLIEDLDMRLRIFESEIEGEKLVTRHVLTQARLNADDLAEIKTKLRHFGDDIVLIKAAQLAQGTTMNIVLQDVTALRTDATELRRGLEATNARLDATNARLDAIDVRLDAMKARLDAMDVRLDAMKARLDAMDERLDAELGALRRGQETMHAEIGDMKRKLDAILAAVSPRGPA